MRRLPLLLALAACTAVPTAAPESGMGALVVAGEIIPVSAPVRNFQHPEGYDAHREHCWFEPGRVEPRRPAPGCEGPRRYGPRRGPGGPEAPAPATLESLREVVDQFVVHFDACVNSRRCFEVLHDIRGLSVHFLLDLDGTIYQTLDLRERARHATIANDRSIGVEIAHIGAYASPESLGRWYRRDVDGQVRFEADGMRLGLRNPDFVPVPARPGVFSGVINGTLVHQRDFTDAQYRSLATLVRDLRRIFPRIRLEVPRGPDGQVLDRVLTPEEFAGFQGILGHWHVQANKTDPGPAFDWERLLREAAGPPAP